MTGVSRIGLILPLHAASDGYVSEMDALRRLIDDGVVGSLWVRDLPAVAADDPDAGQRSDPWWRLGQVSGAGLEPRHLGTASVILGTRHPLVVARAAAGAQVDTGGRFILGVGSGGKPEMNAALGIAGRSYGEFAAQWARLRAALTGDRNGEGDEGSVSLHLPTGYRPPPLYLASSDVRRWDAIDGNADGWQTFLTDDRSLFDHRRAQVDALRGSPTATDLRLDLQVVADAKASASAEFTHPARGRVRCAIRQIRSVVMPWRDAPVDRVLVRITGGYATEALGELRAHWS